VPRSTIIGGNLIQWNSCVHTRTPPLRRIPELNSGG